MDRVPTYAKEQITVTVESPMDKLLVEHALVMSQELRAATFLAPHGQVFDSCEESAVDLGRDFIRTAIQAASQEFIDQAEKKGGLCGPVHADIHASTKGLTSKTR
jgi:hypothetical protein